jgi:hypothetical protein
VQLLTHEGLEWGRDHLLDELFSPVLTGVPTGQHDCLDVEAFSRRAEQSDLPLGGFQVRIVDGIWLLSKEAHYNTKAGQLLFSPSRPFLIGHEYGRLLRQPPKNRLDVFSLADPIEELVRWQDAFPPGLIGAAHVSIGRRGNLDVRMDSAPLACAFGWGGFSSGHGLHLW